MYIVLTFSSNWNQCKKNDDMNIIYKDGEIKRE